MRREIDTGTGLSQLSNDTNRTHAMLALSGTCPVSPYPAAPVRMTYSRGRMLSALALLLCPMRPLAAQPPAALPSDPVRLQWLAGCWAQRAPGRLIEEQWMVPQGGVMIGMSRTVVRDTARSWEFCASRRRGPSGVHRHAQWSGGDHLPTCGPE